MVSCRCVLVGLMCVSALADAVVPLWCVPSVEKWVSHSEEMVHVQFQQSRPHFNRTAHCMCFFFKVAVQKVKRLRVHGNSKASEQLHCCITSLTRLPTVKVQKEGVCVSVPEAGTQPCPLVFPQRGDGSDGGETSKWRGREREGERRGGGGGLVQTCYVILDCGQLQGQLLPGCRVEETGNQQTGEALDI